MSKLLRSLSQRRESGHVRRAPYGDSSYVGAKSGAVVDSTGADESDDERILFASFAGSKKDPAWVHNLRATPEIKIELADGAFMANIEECSTEEAASRVAHQVTVSEQFKAYVESPISRDSRFQNSRFAACRALVPREESRPPDAASDVTPVSRWSLPALALFMILGGLVAHCSLIRARFP